MGKSNFKKVKKILKYLVLILVSFFLLVFVLLSNKINTSKNYYSHMLSGKNNLEMAISEIKKQNYTEAKKQAIYSNNEFSEALELLSDIQKNKVAAYFYPITTSVDDLEYLTKTTEVLSKSLVRVTTILAELENVTSGRFTNNFSDLSEADRREILTIIYQSAPELNGLKANILLSLANLDKIHRIGILTPLDSKIADIKDQLNTASTLLDKAVPLSQLLPALAGYPQESNFLVILQNNDELRPTGGFIGTYGLMTTKDGKPGNIITEDVYHLDMPCVGKLTVTPPQPIKKYMGVEYWWLRDANFSPDFPTSAKQVETMFMSESKCAEKPVTELTAVIALNPGFISDLLSLVGPITIDGATYDSNNFQPLLQYNVEVAYVDKNINSWDRKEIINSVVSELEKRLMSLPTKRFLELFNILQENIARRNLQIYFKNSEQERIAQDLNITGELKKTSSDYLMVVDANLAAFKSDSVMKKNIIYKITGNNKLTATVNLNYKHEGGYDWRTTRYRSYTRIYAPLGSKIINNSKLEDFSTTNDSTLEKTVFGFFWTVEPGTEKTISISYSLPEDITSTNYSLYFQKQSGSRLNNFTFKDWSGTLDRDKIFY